MDTPTREELEAKLALSEARVGERLANFDTSIKTGFAELRAEIADMRAEAHKSAIEVTRWVVGFGVAILGTVFALSKTDKLPSQPTPIIITVPAGSMATAAAAPAPAPTTAPVHTPGSKK
jgi:hypothetical protein